MNRPTQQVSLRMIISAVCMLWCFPSDAQDLAVAISEEASFRQTGMFVLGGWAVANIAGGLSLRANTEGSARYFHEMNALWNTVNLGIATAGYFAAAKMNTEMTALELLREQDKLDKILLFNAGLDLAYIGLGAWMTERSRNAGKNQDRWLGYGQSIMLQGGFLFVFDVAMVALHSKLKVPQSLIMGMSFGEVPIWMAAWRF